MARIGLIDRAPNLLPVAWRLEHHFGHDVRYYTVLDKWRLVGQGLVTRVDDLEDITEWKPDVVLGYEAPQECKRVEAAKIPVICTSEEMQHLEDDRMYATQVARQHGLAVPETKEFTTIDKARKWVETNGARHRWVFKACGDKVDVASTHVCQDHDQLLEVLDFEESLHRAKRFILQERIDGVEISTEGWFDYRTGWINPINSTLERKHLFSGDTGQMTGCMGSVVWTWPQERPLIFRQTLEKLVNYLTAAKWVGPLDVNCILDYKHHTPHFLEFTPRLGWNAFEALMAGSEDIGAFFVALGKGQAKSFPVHAQFMAAVRLYAPCLEGLPVRIALDEDPRLFPGDLYKDDDDVIRLVGREIVPGMDEVGNATATGNSIERIMSEIYEDVIPQVVVPDLGYRDDIGEKASRDLELLESWGYVVHEDPSRREAARQFVSVG